MPKINLTQSLISKLTCPPGRNRIEYCDTQIPGLFLEVRHTGGKTFYLRYRCPDKGSTKYRKLGIHVDLPLVKARKKAAVLRGALLEGKYPGDDKQEKKQCMTFSEFFEQKYLPFAKNNKRSWRDDKKLFTSRINERFGHLPLDKISRHDIQLYHGELRESLSPATCDHVLGLISRCMKLAVDWELLDKNPAAGLKKFNVDNTRNIFLTPEELGRLLRILDNDSIRMPCLAVKLMLFTGSRVGETLHATWNDIDTDSAVWTVKSENSKSRRVRNIPLGTAALEVLEELSSLRINEFVFTSSRSRTGERLKSIDKVWQRLRIEAGLPTLVLHGARHHFASTLANAGVDLYQIQKILGHASPVQTQRYSHLSGTVLQDAANSINGYLDKATNRNVGSDN